MSYSCCRSHENDRMLSSSSSSLSSHDDEMMSVSGSSDSNQLPYPSFPLRNKPNFSSALSSTNHEQRSGGCCGGNGNSPNAPTTSNHSPNHSTTSSTNMHYCACKNQFQPNADCEFKQFLTRYTGNQLDPGPTNSANNNGAITTSNKSTSPSTSSTRAETRSSKSSSPPTPSSSKANTSCLLCKLRHRKCDYTYPCTHCAKENRTFCLYIGNVKRGPKKHKDDMEDEDETSVLSKENIDGIYKIIYQNIANIKSDPQVISKLSFELFKKIVDKLLPNSERDLVHQIVKVALLPPTEPFTGDMDYYFKYFYKIGEKDIALISILQAICLQRLNEKSLGQRMYEKARSKISAMFDQVSDFKLIAVYIFLAIFLIGEGERQKAEYYLNHVKFYVKEFQPNMQEAQFLLRTVLLSESILQESYEQLLRHYENILLYFTPNSSTSQTNINTISSYITASNEKMFRGGNCRISTDSGDDLKKQLSHLKTLIETNNTEYPLGYHQLLDSLMKSSNNSSPYAVSISSSTAHSENLDKKVEQINMAIENIRSIYGQWDFLGNTFIMMLYSIIILHHHKQFNDEELSIDAVKCADMITKTTECNDDFSLSSFPASIPISIACRIHLTSLKTVLKSTSLIINEYAEQLTTYMQLDIDALEMLATKFPLVERKFGALIKEATACMGKYHELKRTSPSKFITLQSISQHLSV